MTLRHNLASFASVELTSEQKEQIKEWINSGATLSQVQEQIRQQFSISLNYMETRFLVDDLKIALKDKEEDTPSPKEEIAEALPEAEEIPEPSASPGSVRVTISEITPPHALIGGQVTFSDGVQGEWFLDQMGRLSLNASQAGYRPSQSDVTAFQSELQRLIQSKGF